MDQARLLPALRVILTSLHMSGVEAIFEDIGSRPFSADHDVVSRLVPEVIAHWRCTPRLLPRAFHLEGLPIQQHKTPWAGKKGAYIEVVGHRPFPLG